jgi:hypothetical protein
VGLAVSLCSLVLAPWTAFSVCDAFAWAISSAADEIQLKTIAEE